MTRLADAEKLAGKSHWTIYDGKGGVYRAKRDATSRIWHAAQINGQGYVTERTLRDLRATIATLG